MNYFFGGGKKPIISSHIQNLEHISFSHFFQVLDEKCLCVCVCVCVCVREREREKKRERENG
jgi:hypothetical protein